MKVWKVFARSVRVYFKNFADLMGAYFIEGVLRAMCFVPLLFLLEEKLTFLAWGCVPMYLLIALPARQNYALAIEDMLQGGRVFSPRLISLDGYLGKLGRGLMGTLKMALWLALPVTAVALMVQLYFGVGELPRLVMGLWGLEGRDGITAMSWFKMLGRDTIDGLKNLLLVVAATFLLPVIGCGVHCGARHQAACGRKGLLRGRRWKLLGLWAAGFLLFLPFAAVALFVLGSNLKLFISGFAQMFMTKSFAVPELGSKLYILAGAFVLLFLTMAPLKQLLPAVALHEAMEKETKTDAAP